jgi:hypothetical protein
VLGAVNRLGAEADALRSVLAWFVGIRADLLLPLPPGAAG